MIVMVPVVIITGRGTTGQPKSDHPSYGASDTTQHTVDGSEVLNNHLECINPVNNGRLNMIKLPTSTGDRRIMTSMVYFQPTAAQLAV